MSTKAEVVAAIDAAKTLAEALPDDQAAIIAQLTQERDAARAEIVTLKADGLALVDQLDAADQVEDDKRAALRAKFE
jgi:hypothetical protein